MTTYERLPVFRAPCCLIENCSDGTLKTCSDVLDQLSKISSPLNVIAITGPSRTGKSYLLNRLAGKQEGFQTGPTIEATTKGIWVWCLPHPNRLNEVILLLDTEGQGDIQKGNEENDNWIFAISLLLSSTLVYNSMNVIGQDGLSKLHYVTELTQRIKTTRTSTHTDGGDFYRIFPHFVWALRDVHCRLEKEGQPITPDDYLTNALKLKNGTGKAVDDYNRPRQCITHFFRDKKCFVFPLPAKQSAQLEELEKLPDSEIDPKFLNEVERFSSYIYTSTFPKTASDQPIHGTMFCNLLENYVNVIQAGEIPCVQDAVKNMTEKENEYALKVSVDLWDSMMNERLTSINSEQELSEAYDHCNREALQRFMSMSRMDEQQKYQYKLKEVIGQKFKEICQKKGMEQKDKEISELKDSFNQLNDLQLKLQEEEGNAINELGRMIRQREEENQINEAKNIILRQQLEELRRERDQHKRNLEAIRQGGPEFAKYLHSAGSVLVTFLKFTLAGSVGILFAGSTAVLGGVAGAATGGGLCLTIASTGAVISIIPGGAILGGALGVCCGFGWGIIKALEWISNNID